MISSLFAAATCVGCGCTDHRACTNPHSGEPCSWLRVDRAKGTGVCSECPDFTSRWDAEAGEPGAAGITPTDHTPPNP
ncbi:MAG: hypothetical protein EPN40_09875 [Rhodanobacteraceae bacterium]|nr:MAG: hypothetical protein EPN40_09875 [Rhodanobacteraceae bacterium]